MTDLPEGEDLAAQLLAAARTKAGQSPARKSGRPFPNAASVNRPTTSSSRSTEPLYSGPRADARDPSSISGIIGDFIASQGWQERTRVAGALARWSDIVGADIAENVQAESFDDGTLVVRARSTAWATQMRLLTGSIRRKIDDHLGEGVVTTLVVKGPEPPRQRGRWRVQGRGPRDTYG